MPPSLGSLAGVVERRLLVNYRVDSDVVARLLPAPFRPQLVGASAVAGICLIRLGSMRPKVVPLPVGLRSENAAHRIAVEWDTDDGVACGVYIPRRDSSSLVNVVVGGRLYPGEHHPARFSVTETDAVLRVAFAARDRSAEADVTVRVVPGLEGSRLFEELAEASAFFERGAIGYRPRIGRGGSTASSSRPTPGGWTRPRCWRRGPRSSTTPAASRPGRRCLTARWSCARYRSPGSRSRRS